MLNKGFTISYFEIDKNETNVIIAINKNLYKYNINKSSEYTVLKGHKMNIKLIRLDFTMKYIYR